MVLLPHPSLWYPNVEGTYSESLLVLTIELFREDLHMFLKQLVSRRKRFQYYRGCVSSSRTVETDVAGLLLNGDTIL